MAENDFGTGPAILFYTFVAIGSITILLLTFALYKAVMFRIDLNGDWLSQQGSDNHSTFDPDPLKLPTPTPLYGDVQGTYSVGHLPPHYEETAIVVVQED
ncbi:hypothetical protein EDD86DRAFT_249331 [Gorgonomyces haynaldii]|nr:hypothetical protein EDD86DRAFT_249331 [Gorgonomyces haynaldii]